MIRLKCSPTLSFTRKKNERIKQRSGKKRERKRRIKKVKRNKE
jgi:hypothetical protein